MIAATLEAGDLALVERRVYPRAEVSFAAARPEERSAIIAVIDSIAGERRYLQTDRYCPTPAWEHLLVAGWKPADQQVLLAVKAADAIIGYGRLTAETGPQGEHHGNIGVGLLRPYRSQGIGTGLLGALVMVAQSFALASLSADILASNERSLRLFHRFGFAVEHRHFIMVPYNTAPVEEVLVRRYLAG